MAMLAKQGWRLLQAPNSLCFKVLSARYLPDGDILNARPAPGISYVCRSILKGIRLLKEGLIWRVGDGTHINIWSDPWLPRGSMRHSTSRQGNAIVTKVSELIDPVTGSWDVQLVNQLFSNDEISPILAIPIVEDMDDFLAWHLDSRGVFSVKSAYKIHVNLLRQQLGSAGSSSGQGENWKGRIWKNIWKAECPPKVHHFLWRFSHNSHPLRRNIEKKGVELDTRCVICTHFFEDGGHLFFKCKEVRVCWRALNLEHIRLKLAGLTTPMDVLEQVFALPADEKLKVICLLWSWWKERNKCNHGERRLNADQVRAMVLRVTDEWLEHLKKTSKPEAKVVQSWKPPPTDVIKVNIDGAFSGQALVGGWGAIGRDHLGDPIFATCGRIPIASEPLQAELQALLQAIPVAEQLGIRHVIFSTDCIPLKEAISSNSYDASRLGPLFQQAKYMLRLACFEFVFEYCPRACNKTAHELAALGVGCEQPSEVLWLTDFPSDVMTLVANDVVGP
jgi:hypothetical protein